MVKTTPTRTVKVLHGMIEMTVIKSRYLGLDKESSEISEMLANLSGYKLGVANDRYADIVTFVKNMKFNWKLHKDVPDEYKTVEEWWGMVESNKPEVDCFIYFIDNVPNPVTIELITGIVEAQKVWTPSIQRDDSEGETDPN